jgi:methylmalonyl-CoA mutase
VRLLSGDERAVARTITVLGAETDADLVGQMRTAAGGIRPPDPGPRDHRHRRLRQVEPDRRTPAPPAARLSRTRSAPRDRHRPDPARGGGALLGDRIRMNAIEPGVVYFRSVATRSAGGVVPANLDAMVDAAKVAGFDLVIVETPGIGQGDAAITDHADVSLYVMTPEFGAASQLEKIDMLDFADVVAINKFERRGGEDARATSAANSCATGRRSARRGRTCRSSAQAPPASTTTASPRSISTCKTSSRPGARAVRGPAADGVTRSPAVLRQVVPPQRERYLAEIAETVRDFHEDTRAVAKAARRVQRLTEVGAAARAEADRRRRCATLRRPGRPAAVGRRASSRGGARSSRPTRATSRS